MKTRVTRRWCSQLLLISLVVLSPAVARGADGPAAPDVGMARRQRAEAWARAHPVWRGVHLLLRDGKVAESLDRAIPDLKAAGINLVIAEVNYGFAFVSHPELRAEGAISREVAAGLARRCREHGIRLVPQFSSIGHQSWAGTTFPLLVRHPDMDETPGQFPGNKGIYCRSWCPRHPKVNEIVFRLMDEILDGFEADAMHVGLDEVFLIASEHCSRCRGASTADVFAQAVIDLHGHLVGKRGAEMLMWADRLLDAERFGYGEWEAAKNGTATAVDRIPKDIVLCDWHYEPLEKYPGKPADYGSVPYLMEKGFRVLPCGWRNSASTRALAESAMRHKSPRLLGHLCSTWGAVQPSDLATWPPLVAAMEIWRDRP